MELIIIIKQEVSKISTNILRIYVYHRSLSHHLKLLMEISLSRQQSTETNIFVPSLKDKTNRHQLQAYFFLSPLSDFD